MSSLTAGSHAAHSEVAPELDKTGEARGHLHVFDVSSNLTACPLALDGHGSPQAFPALVGIGYSPDAEHAVTFVPSHVAPVGQSAHTAGSTPEFQNLPSPQVHLARPAD